MNVFRGIFNRLNNNGSSGGNRGGSGDRDEMAPTTLQSAQRLNPPMRKPKQFNSDWNTVVEEDDNDANLFFSIFSAPQQAVKESRNTILSQNKAKVRRQIILQQKSRQLPSRTDDTVNDTVMLQQEEEETLKAGEKDCD